VTARHLCRCNFSIHRNNPVPLALAIKAQIKYFEATGSALAKNTWAEQEPKGVLL
jgi:hypothetical protein